MADERDAWNRWNLENHRELALGRPSREQAEVIEGWMNGLGPKGDLRILDIGCGTGWMSRRLAAHGHVTGVDLADEALAVASSAVPGARFLCGDFLTVEVPDMGSYDVAVAMESMAHVRDQPAFLRRIATALRPGGVLMIAAQNRTVMERNIAHLPSRGWYRRWVDHEELRALVAADFVVDELRSITPIFFDGPLRILNSERFERFASRIALGGALRRIKRWEEDRFLGWTLMCRARRP
jgi:SAM-dependent methyltransferase